MKTPIEQKVKRAVLVITSLGTLLASSASWAYIYTVPGYTRSNGTYVDSHLKSSPDGNPYNNLGYGR